MMSGSVAIGCSSPGGRLGRRRRVGAGLLLRRVRHAVAVGVVGAVEHRVAVGVAGPGRHAQVDLDDVAHAVAVGVLEAVQDPVAVGVVVDGRHPRLVLVEVRDPVAVAIDAGVVGRRVQPVGRLPDVRHAVVVAVGQVRGDEAGAAEAAVRAIGAAAADGAAAGAAASARAAATRGDGNGCGAGAGVADGQDQRGAARPRKLDRVAGRLARARILLDLRPPLARGELHAVVGAGRQGVRPRRPAQEGRRERPDAEHPSDQSGCHGAGELEIAQSHRAINALALTIRVRQRHSIPLPRHLSASSTGSFSLRRVTVERFRA